MKMLRIMSEVSKAIKLEVHSKLEFYYIKSC